jgi:cytochrome c peroxidase
MLGCSGVSCHENEKSNSRSRRLFDLCTAFSFRRIKNEIRGQGTSQDIKKNAKKVANKVKDETCELVNGKMECVAKKMVHKAENLKEEVKDATH